MHIFVSLVEEAYMSNKKELIYSYLAGFIDADGSITITIERSKRKTKTGEKLQEQYCVKLSAHNCKIEPIQMLSEEFGGGKIRFKKTGKAKNHDNWRPCYEWMITKNKAALAIKLLLPFLLIKKKQAELCLQLDKIKKTHSASKRRWNPELNEKINNQFVLLKSEVNLLNKRGQ